MLDGVQLAFRIVESLSQLGRIEHRNAAVSAEGLGDETGKRQIGQAAVDRHREEQEGGHLSPGLDSVGGRKQPSEGLRRIQRRFDQLGLGPQQGGDTLVRRRLQAHCGPEQSQIGVAQMVEIALGNRDRHVLNVAGL